METRNNDIEELVFGYFAQDLTPAQEQELLDWLQQDPAHKKIYARLADEWAVAHVPLFIANRQKALDHFFDQQQQREHPRKQSRMRSFSFVRYVAAAILALVTLGATVYLMHQHGANERYAQEGSATLPTSSEMSTPMGMTMQMLLPDGTKAWMNAGSTLSYTYNETAKLREVHLEGEAFFDVVPDATRPFVVYSDELAIQVLGTSFNVKAYANDPQVKVALVSGSVNVKLQQTDEAMDFTLSPERMLTFYKADECVAITHFKKQNVLAWKNGDLRFENLSFAAIARDLERKFDVRIHMESQQLPKEIFTGSFSAAYSLNQILDEVDVENKYQWRKENGELIISDK